MNILFLNAKDRSELQKGALIHLAFFIQALITTGCAVLLSYHAPERMVDISIGAITVVMCLYFCSKILVQGFSQYYQTCKRLGIRKNFIHIMLKT